jgi:hypothetical protein
VGIRLGWDGEEHSLDYNHINHVWALHVNILELVEWTRRLIILTINALDDCGSKADLKISIQFLSKLLLDLYIFIQYLLRD